MADPVDAPAAESTLPHSTDAATMPVPTAPVPVRSCRRLMAAAAVGPTGHSPYPYSWRGP